MKPIQNRLCLWALLGGLLCTTVSSLQAADPPTTQHRRPSLTFFRPPMTADAATYESRKDHKEYDFHYDIRYPGRLRSDVGRDKVSEKNAQNLKAYNRRVVVHSYPWII